MIMGAKSSIACRAYLLTIKNNCLYLREDAQLVVL
jgi:hypothetical protein